MHYVIRRFHRMQKRKFSVTCPGALFRETVRSHPSMKNSASMFHTPDALECTTWPIDPTGFKNTVSAKHFPACFLSYPYRSHPRMKNSALTYCAPDAQECTTWPIDPTGCKKKFSITCPDVLFVEFVPVPPEHEKHRVDILCPRRTVIHYMTHRSYWM
jgi:hypothetical protein